MFARMYPVRFERPIPTLDVIARRFQELTGVELIVDEPSCSLTAPPLKGHIELELAADIKIVMFKRGYFEDALKWTLYDLGGLIPCGQFRTTQRFRGRA